MHPLPVKGPAATGHSRACLRYVLRHDIAAPSFPSVTGVLGGRATHSACFGLMQDQAQQSAACDSSQFRLMTYNVHACRGTDGAYDVGRVAAVVAEAKPDLLLLQEVDVSQERSSGVDQGTELARHLGMHVHFTCAFQRGGGKYGIAMLAGEKPRIVLEGCLPSVRDEVRAAQWARLSVAGVELDVVHTHLSVKLQDRDVQLKSLFGSDWLQGRLSHPHLIIGGDLNALPFSSVYRELSRHLRDVQRISPGKIRATWPSARPFARIDHIFVGRGFEVKSCWVPNGPKTRVASDHLPLLADLRALRVAR